MNACTTLLAFALLTVGGAEASVEASGAAVAEAEPLRECVILVHGLARRKLSMRALDRALRGCGFDVVNWDYLSTRGTISESAKALHHAYTLNARYHSRVHFVTHSLGGILVRAMLKQHHVPKLGRIVMIAPPNHGSAVARMLLDGPLGWFGGPPGHELQSKEHLDAICATPKTPTLIIAGTKGLDAKNPVSWVSQGALEKPHDGTVSVAETRLTGVETNLEVADSHTGLPHNPKVIEATTAFLRQDRGVDDDERQLLRKGLRILSANPAQIDALLAHIPAMPNVKAPTLGGAVWWADLVVVDGWRVQKNVLLKNCRLLDPLNVRRAWGSQAAMLRAFEALVKQHGTTH